MSTSGTQWTFDEIDEAFATLAKRPNAAMLVGVDPLFDSRPNQLVQLAAKQTLPAAYYLREFVQAGGLMSYGASITDTYRQAGVYAEPTRLEWSNLKTAKTLGLDVVLAAPAACRRSDRLTYQASASGTERTSNRCGGGIEDRRGDQGALHQDLPGLK